ncbi:hypothetical protein [Methanococcus maripaludis]|uniref:Uncharacterized protein n=1 Tax=Methanococcus maripaludis TaxID=39152 RepID=A0A8T3W4T2_METMI|nr:hypothetical protein [Methanococcus maripaludis]MBG0768340.1 hypothetical protein [Methanococcus maripaludis]
MRIPIVVCPSILCLYVTGDIFDKNCRMLPDELNKRIIVLNEKVEEIYSEYFLKKGEEIHELYMTKLSDMIQYSEIGFESKDEFIENLSIDEDLKVLLNVCNSTEYKIILSERLDGVSTELNGSGITKLNLEEVFDETLDHDLNKYRFPCIKRVELNDSTNELSKWLSKILKSEKNFQIWDRYITSTNPPNFPNFQNYFLNNIDNNSEITVYTLIWERASEGSIKHAFSTIYNRKIHVYGFKHKEVQHDREIFTDNYHIVLGNGFGTFGSGNDKTTQSVIQVLNIESSEKPKVVGSEIILKNGKIGLTPIL